MSFTRVALLFLNAKRMRRRFWIPLARPAAHAHHPRRRRPRRKRPCTNSVAPHGSVRYKYLPFEFREERTQMRRNASLHRAGAVTHLLRAGILFAAGFVLLSRGPKQ